MLVAGTVLVHLYAAAVALKSASTSPSPPPPSRIPSSSSSSSKSPNLSNGHARQHTLPCIYVQCQSPFPQIEEFVDRCSTRYSLDLQRISAPMKEALRRYKHDRETLHAQKVEAVLVGTRIGDPYSGRSKLLLDLEQEEAYDLVCMSKKNCIPLRRQTRIGRL